MNHVVLASLAVGCVASSALAQSMNIDVGNATATPASTYGAAAGSTGVWNTYTGGTLTNLADLSGFATGASMSGTSGGFLGGYNDPGTFGDDEALMDDSLVIPFLETYTLSGLAAGTYSVFVYVWTFSALSTQVTLNSQAPQIVGGAWPGGFVAGITHMVDSVTIAQGQDIVIDVHSVNGALGGFSGMQVVQVPGPSALALLLACSATGRRRRA